MDRDLARYTADYLALPFEATQAAMRRRLVLEQIGRWRPATLLEVGCGLAPLFTDLPGVDCTVVEPTQAFAERALQLADGRRRVRVHHGYLHDLAADAAGFDMVIVGCLLHELPEPDAFLAAVRRRCASHTVLHVNVPNAHSLHRLLAVAMGLIDTPFALSDTQRRMQQRGTYDLAGLQEALATAGFRTLDSGSLFVKPFTHAQMQELQDSGFLTPALLEGLYRLVEWLPAHGSEIYANARLAHG